MKFNLMWESASPELNDKQIAILAREIVWLETYSEDASEVVSHVVNLTEDDTGPSILINGRTGNSTDLFLNYTEKTEWIVQDDTEQ